MSAPDPIAARDDLSVIPWAAGRAVMVHRAGDDLNDDDGLVLTADEARWLFIAAGPLVLIALRDAEAETRERRRA